MRSSPPRLDMRVFFGPLFFGGKTQRDESDAMSGNSRQIEMMCSFIDQEAKEKVNELNLKTSHDANLEKQMTVHNEKTKIMKEFKQKQKMLMTEKRIAQSRAVAQFRVRTMTAREELLEQVKQAAVEALNYATADKTKYTAMIEDLIVQGLIKLNEAKVEVIVRESDVDIAKKVKDSAVTKYIQVIKQATGQTATCTLEVNPNGKCLPPAPDGSGKKSCCGGVQLLVSNGRIVCDNTLDTRLAVSFDQLMPEVRSSLFSIRV